ncbi:hypothetical protein ACROYT_G021624 [Oculina patagonica]
MTPTEASKKKNEGTVYFNLYGDMEPLSAKPKFKTVSVVKIWACNLRECFWENVSPPSWQNLPVRLCPSQVAVDMRNAKNEDNERMFTRTEWLTKNQIQRFFSRLTAKRRKDQGVVGMSPDDEEDVQCLQENSDRQVLVDEVNREINVSHPICYDTYDLCERYHSNTLQKFNVVMLKAICSHFEIHVKSKEKKQLLIDKGTDMIRECVSD